MSNQPDCARARHVDVKFAMYIRFSAADNVVDAKCIGTDLQKVRHSSEKLGHANACFQPPSSARGMNALPFQNQASSPKASMELV